MMPGAVCSTNVYYLFFICAKLKGEKLVAGLSWTLTGQSKSASQKVRRYLRWCLTAEILAMN